MDVKPTVTLRPANQMSNSEIAYETQRMAILRDHYAGLLRTVEARQRELAVEQRKRGHGMSKLDEIKAAWDDFNKAHQIYLEACNTPMSKEEFTAIDKDTEKKWAAVQALLVGEDYLRLLLAVATAARELDYEWLQRAQREMTYTDEDLKPLNRLEDALKALD